MLKSGITGKLIACAFTLVLGLLGAQAAFAQTTPPINPGDAAPLPNGVPERNGLLGTWYTFTGATPPAATPTSPVTPHITTFTLVGEVLDSVLNTDFVANKPPILGGTNSDMFLVEWTGRVVIPANDNYTFFTASDDGERTWINDVVKTTPDMNFWVQRGVVEDPSAAIALTTGMTNVRIEFEQGNGGAACYFRWQSGTIAKAIVPSANLRPPPGPAAPTLAAVSPVAPPPAMVNLSWNQPAGATGYIISRNGTVLAVINSGTTLAYADSAVTYGTAYTYVIQATSHATICIGPASNQQTVTPVLPAVTVTPQTGLQTNENGAQAVATITFNQALAGGQSVTFNVVINLPTEAVASALGQGPAGTINFTVNGPVTVGQTFPLTLTGVDDVIVDPAHAYTVTVTTTGQFGAVTIPVLNCVNNDNDTPGMTINRTSGLLTSESGGFDTFSVVLNTKPTSAVNVPLSSSVPTEGVPSPASLQFTTTDGQAYNGLTGIGGWNVAHIVTVTGADDQILDQAQPYTITAGAVTSADPNYNLPATAIGCVNLDNEVPPTLDEVWGGSGCGLLGLELLLPLVLAALLRRRS